ncbi:MAG TPA: protease complex subunit PrcB family protein [Anaeromyxobacteraceae bacterium]|nr:protease complex subunit PrcB family protein [Anaeromyxobacteraceae bacterium]
MVATEADWQQTWAELFACQSPAPPVPPIDFTHEMLVLAAVGARGSSGYSVAIEGAAVRSDGALHVNVVEYRPGRGCAVATVITYPVAVARVSRVDVPVAFHDRVQTLDCE